MKAVILAAGKGSRISTLVKDVPKPMILYENKPILEHNIMLCKTHGIEDIYINTSHLADLITDYFRDGNKWGVKINYSFEPELLGTAGALSNFKSQLKGNNFLVIYGDNFSSIDLSKLIAKHEKSKATITVALHYREDVSQSGVAEFLADGKITKFIEKPKTNQTQSHWVNAGIYVVSSKIFEYLPYGFSDFGIDIFPLLLQKNISLYCECFHDNVLAFDSPEMYLKNKK